MTTGTTSPFVKLAYDLFIETLPLDTLDINDPVQAAEFHDLYAKECQLFGVMRQFSYAENMEYVRLMRQWRVNHEATAAEMFKDTDPNLVDWTMQTK